jgi:hypothetical protein
MMHHGIVMEFLTLHQLARELNKPEKVLRYKFKNLLKKNALVEGEDFVREGYIDDKHFLFKINPVRFTQLTELIPAPPPDITGYQVGTNIANNGYPTDTTSGNQVVTKPPEVDTNVGNHQKITDTNDAQESINKTVTNEFIELMKEQLREKDKQLKEKDDQLKSKDALLKEAQAQAREKDNTQILALSEIIRLNKKLLPPSPGESAINVDPNGYQPDIQRDTNSGNQASDGGTNFGNHGYQSGPNKHQQQNFEGDPSSGRGVGSDSMHQ